MVSVLGIFYFVYFIIFLSFFLSLSTLSLSISTLWNLNTLRLQGLCLNCLHASPQQHRFQSNSTKIHLLAIKILHLRSDTLYNQNQPPLSWFSSEKVLFSTISYPHPQRIVRTQQRLHRKKNNNKHKNLKWFGTSCLCPRNRLKSIFLSQKWLQDCNPLQIVYHSTNSSTPLNGYQKW